MQRTEPSGQPLPTELRETRLELHWAAQSLAALADALLAQEADDSQSNLGWDAEEGALVTRPLPAGLHAALLTARGELRLWVQEEGKDAVSGAAQLDLAGQKLATVLDWLASRSSELAGLPQRHLVQRPYDLPDHPAGSGQPFAFADGAAMAELGCWLDLGYRALSESVRDEPQASAVRCWPHHFDFGTLVLLDPDLGPEEGRSIGLGFSPGDGGIGEPYFYVNPYPRPDTDRRPTLASGGLWHEEGWFGAVLHGSNLLRVASESRQSEQQNTCHQLAVDFLGSALDACRELLDTQA